MGELYVRSVGAARAHAQKQYEYHLAEAKRHKGFLDAMDAQNDYLRKEGLLTSEPSNQVDRSAKNASRSPADGGAVNKHGLPMGDKEKFYDDGVAAALAEYGSVNRGMLLKHFKKSGIPVTMGGIKGYLYRARSVGKLETDPNRYGHVVAGPVLAPMVEAIRKGEQVKAMMQRGEQIKIEDLPF